MTEMTLTALTLCRCSDCGLHVLGAHECIEPREVPQTNFERCVRQIAEEKLLRRNVGKR